MLTSVDEHMIRSLPSCPDLDRFEELLRRQAPLLLPALANQRVLFGDPWVEEFDELLRRCAADHDAWLKQSLDGYLHFIFDGMRLQQRFQKTRRYEPKTYADTSGQVYLNRAYMFDCYLPGLLLSHYLWPHHYRQRLFFERAFVSRISQSISQQFCDIGVGTGFYSRVVLSALPAARGWAFDISAAALEYASSHLAAYGVAGRWASEVRDIVRDRPSRTWPFLINVEVLEHLEDPLAFLRSLRAMLAPGGLGFIAAAVTAAEKDHIFLYESARAVEDQLEAADFLVLDQQEDVAYPADGDRPVPRNAAFVVTRS